jgi:hypothetical protein
MDFEQYIKKMNSTLGQMEASGQYDISYTIFPPEIYMDDFEEFIRDELGIEGFHFWQAFKEFYKVTFRFTFRWSYRHRTNYGHSKWGASNISIISLIYEPEEQIGEEFNLYEGYRVFDFVEGEEYWLDGNYVAVHFVEGREEPDFYYYSCDTEMYHKMSIGFLEYMSLLLACRGLYGWQYFFLLDENFPVEYDRANQFLADLELLFPDADSSKYRERLKLFKQNDNNNELGDRLATIGPVSPDNFVTFYSQMGNFGLEAVVPQENYQIAPETLSRLKQWLKAGKLPDGKPLNFIYLIVPSRTAAIRVQEQAKAEGLGSVYYVDNDDNLWSPYPYTDFPDSEDVASVESSYWFNPGTLASSSPDADVDDCINRSRN